MSSSGVAGLLCLCDVTCEQNPCPVEHPLVSRAVPELPSSYSRRMWCEIRTRTGVGEKRDWTQTKWKRVSQVLEFAVGFVGVLSPDLAG